MLERRVYRYKQLLIAELFLIIALILSMKHLNNT